MVYIDSFVIVDVEEEDGCGLTRVTGDTDYTDVADLRR